MYNCDEELLAKARDNSAIRREVQVRPLELPQRQRERDLRPILGEVLRGHHVQPGDGQLRLRLLQGLLRDQVLLLGAAGPRGDGDGAVCDYPNPVHRLLRFASGTERETYYPFLLNYLSLKDVSRVSQAFLLSTGHSGHGRFSSSTARTSRVTG